MNQESQKDIYNSVTERALRFNHSNLLELLYSLHSRERVEILKCSQL